MTSTAVSRAAPMGHRSPPRRNRRTNVLSGAGLVVLLVLGWVLPQPIRGVLLAVACLGFPWALWSFCIAQRVQVGLLVATGLGLIVALAAWSFSFFALMWVGFGASYLASALSFGCVCLYPLLSVDLTVAGREVLAGLHEQARKFFVPFLALAVPAGLGCLALAIAMAMARAHGDTQSVYAVFWLGTALLYVPPLVACLWRPGRCVGSLCFALSVATYAHVFLRSPLKPLMNDELGHWGETETILKTGKLFLPDSVVGVGPQYPGLQTLAAPIVRLVDVPTMWVAQPLVFLFHVAALIGIAALAAAVVGSAPRVLAIAMFVYAINPSMLQIDGIFAYEAFGIPLVIWFVYLVVRESSVGLHDRLLAGCAVLLGLTLIITHHLSSYMAAAILVLCGVCRLVARRSGAVIGPDGTVVSPEPVFGRSRAVVLLGVGIGLAAIAAGWALLRGADLVRYLGGVGPSALTALLRVTRGDDATADGAVGTYEQQQGGSRSLFLDSLLPHFERWAALASQPILFVAFLTAVVVLWRGRNGMRLSMAVLGLAYFVSLPLTLVAGGSSPAHRSWAYSYIGLAVILAGVANLTSHGASGSPRRSRTWPAAVIAAVSLVIVLVGNYGSAVNAYQRLPGPFVLGVDGRNVSQDMVRSAKWFARHEGRGQQILTTLRTRAVFGAYADTQGISFRGWEVFFPTTAPPPQVVAAVRDAGIRYIVVDRRLSTDVAAGVYFGLAGEPDPPDNPLPAASVRKFETLPWLSLIHTDDNILIYRVR